jgi:hypothetical protein
VSLTGHERLSILHTQVRVVAAPERYQATIAAPFSAPDHKRDVGGCGVSRRW